MTPNGTFKYNLLWIHLAFCILMLLVDAQEASL
jgi:hypothetical protein